jgi:hypothetical protein
MDLSRQALNPDRKGDQKGWLFSLLTLPLQEQPLSLVLCLGAATFLLSSSVTAFVLGYVHPSPSRSLDFPGGGVMPGLQKQAPK